MKKIVFLFAVFIALIGATSVMAASIVLSNYELFVDGDYYYSEDNVSGLLDDDLFVWNTGIGTLSLTFNPGAAGPYSVDAWFDHDIYNDDGDGIYEDETAEVVGTPGGNGQFGVATSDFNGFGADMWIGYDDIMLGCRPVRCYLHSPSVVTRPRVVSLSIKSRVHIPALIIMAKTFFRMKLTSIYQAPSKFAQTLYRNRQRCCCS